MDADISENAKAIPPKKERRRWRAWVLCIAVIAICAPVLLWLMRISLVSYFAEAACERRELNCEFVLSDLRLDGAVLSNVVVSTTRGIPFSAQQVELDYAWPRLAELQLKTVRIDGASVEGAFDGRELSFYGLEDIASGDAGGGPLPTVEIGQGAIALETPAGRVEGTMDLRFADRDNVALRASFEPGVFSTDAGRLDIESADLDVRATAGRVLGTVDIIVDEARFGDLEAAGLALRADLSAGPSSGTDVWQYRLVAQRLNYGALSLNALISNGQAEFSGTSRLAGGRDNTSGQLASLSATATADRGSRGGVGLEMIAADLAVLRRGEVLVGPLAISADRVNAEGLTDAREVTLSGEIGTHRSGGVTLDGRLTGRKVAISTGQRSNLLGERSSGLIAEGTSIERLLAAFDTALSEFDLGAEIVAEWDPELGVSLEARGTGRFSAATGMTVAVQGFGDGAWFDYEPDRGPIIRGSFALDGDDVPSVTMNISELRWMNDSFDLSLGETRMAPWSDQGLQFGVELQTASVSASSQRLSLSAVGEVAIDGEIGPLRFAGLRGSGGIDAVRGPEGWRAQLTDRDCLFFRFDALSSGAIDFSGQALSICPPDGRLIRQNEVGPTGRFLISDIDLDFAMPGTRGGIRLVAPDVNWVQSDTFSAEIVAQSIEVETISGGRDFRLSASDAEVSLGIGGTIPVELTGQLRDLRLAGDLVPARVSAPFGVVEVSNASSGLRGKAHIPSLQVADLQTDPIFEPLSADLSARWQGQQVSFDGPIRLRNSQVQVATIEADLAFPRIAGTVRIRVPDLQFTPTGLQPVDLSDRLRGYFTNASGRVEAGAELTISGSNLAGRGFVDVVDFGFQTLALGRVNGVNGNIVFDDLVAMTTPPGQVVRVDSIDPGLVIEDGELRFQLLDRNSARLESAVWPFAEGSLGVAPTVWRFNALSQSMEIVASDIQLTSLTRLLDVPGLAAEGTVSGRFPLAFEAGSVFLRDARLAADAQGGRLRYSGASGVGETAQSESVKLAFDALENFEFDVLEIGADGDLASVLELTVRLAGRNPSILGGTPFNFNIAVDSRIGQLLTSGRRLQDIDWLTELSATRESAAD